MHIDNTESEIKEKYITPWALPNESLFCWVKYYTSLKFNYVVIQLGEDFELEWIGNTNKDFRKIEKDLILDRKKFVTDGLISFVIKYKKIPEEEKEVSLPVLFLESISSDFLKYEAIVSIQLSTKIIRPIIRLGLHDHLYGFLEEPGKPLLIDIINVGSAQVKYGDLFCYPAHREEGKIKMEFDVSEEFEGKIFKRKTISVKATLLVSGESYVMAYVGLRYKDNNDNAYKSEVFVNLKSREGGELTKIPLELIQLDKPQLMIVESVEHEQKSR